MAEGVAAAASAAAATAAAAACPATAFAGTSPRGPLCADECCAPHAAAFAEALRTHADGVTLTADAGVAIAAAGCCGGAGAAGGADAVGCDVRLLSRT
eukprot:6173653-Pleurochrysis_carterae.AAC.1